MHDDDSNDSEDKTVFGQKLPQAAPKDSPAQPQVPPAAAPPFQSPPSGAAEDKTVFGAPMPGQQPPMQQPPQHAPFQPHQQPGSGRSAPAGAPTPPNQDDTWLGGALPPSVGQPQQPPPPSSQPAYGQQPLYQPQNLPSGADMFPEIQRDAPQAAAPVIPRVSLEDALRGTGPQASGSSNPFISAAANLLILLGRLRTGMVELQSGPLIDHVTREIDQFERNLNATGLPPNDIREAKYALAATADDIVQNLPGADRGTWMQYAMVPRFFGERNAGVEFYRKMDQAMQSPTQHFQLLELMLTCMSLGFEGQYRTMGSGTVELSRARSALYETLRRVQPRPDDDISIAWTAVPLGVRRRYGGTPVWAVAVLGLLMVLALYATLATLITREGGQVQARINALHDGLPGLAIERPETIVVEQVQAPATSQLMRIRDALSQRINAGEVEIEPTSDFILVRVGQVLQFDSGLATLRTEFSDLADDIATALEPEVGPIRIIGYTDNIPPSGLGLYKSNEELSEARAQAVADIVAPFLSDPTRIAVEGLGPVNPVADNETREGRALNRRVEIMIQREVSQ